MDMKERNRPQRHSFASWTKLSIHDCITRILRTITLAHARVCNEPCRQKTVNMAGLLLGYGRKAKTSKYELHYKDNYRIRKR